MPLRLLSRALRARLAGGMPTRHLSLGQSSLTVPETPFRLLREGRLRGRPMAFGSKRETRTALLPASEKMALTILRGTLTHAHKCPMVINRVLRTRMELHGFRSDEVCLR